MPILEAASGVRATGVIAEPLVHLPLFQIPRTHVRVLNLNNANFRLSEGGLDLGSGEPEDD
jgi:hypothetical protein